MDADRRIIDNGAVLVDGNQIAAVGGFAEVRAASPQATIAGSALDLVVPGYLNAHQHLTGDRLIKSSIPDDLPPGEAISSWVLPIHAEHTTNSRRH